LIDSLDTIATRRLRGAMVIMAGWYGAERIFFQSQLAGRAVSLRHLVGLVRPFAGRFVRLGVIFGVGVMTSISSPATPPRCVRPSHLQRSS
jgi:hypothetical protein